MFSLITLSTKLMFLSVCVVFSCWMAWEPSLGGFYAPMGLLVLVMSVYFLCTYIQLKRHPERKYELRVLSEEQQQLSSSESNHADVGGASGPAVDCHHLQLAFQFWPMSIHLNPSYGPQPSPSFCSFLPGLWGHWRYHWDISWI